ncbi:type I DNA topoisomerase [Anaeromicrobium sediminis]|uniref:DNA topoisomerase 1 n=1 Tax=Anaeromicrobium sediminis TaxID=1478221 RepID=A0A267MRB7_9FIRM|nr:type I DNA topoisomerase [Anaeromicrobium sediminis]PAB61280.1 DNA topoisomerase I [Anaeromicrobium sediminis]
MGKSLVIVESPAKAKTIGKFLGKNYKVLASVGHVRDLPKSKMGIDIEENYEPHYITIRGKGPVIKELKKEYKKAKKVLLATDPDREGEAISWHLCNILSIDEKEKCRIEFNEITKDAIKKAVKKPRIINKSLVDAQQARRVLDRLVGYSISPLLWRKVRKGLSAGRVQSVVTKMICDREKEIDDFQPQEYWTIEVGLSKGRSKKFTAKFYGDAEGKKELNNKEEVDNILEKLNDDFHVSDIKTKQKKRKPGNPFTTSSLQQEASNRLGFSTKKTMSVAQQLYEGIDLERGATVGLITYVRTDSTRISEEAKNDAKDFILENYSEDYLGEYKEKKKTKKEIQDAHEAIRPTSASRTPKSVEKYLTKDQNKLYKLIWERFVASQMKEAIFDSYSIEIINNGYLFKASGSKNVFDGFLKVYSYTTVKEEEMPKVEIQDKLKAKKIDPLQHFTQPPARFTEASLVKELEEKGIGRPSTYAPTISTILSRGYVERESKALKPTELGIIVTDLLKEYFNDILDEYFTAQLEEQLDKVEETEMDWKKVIDDFYNPFSKTLEHAEEEIKKIELIEEETDEICEECGKNMVIKYGRYGRFLACSGYPECEHTRPFVKKIGVKCPKCDGGDIIERRSKKGKLFYGCSTFPNCNFVSWSRPIDEKCEKCGTLMAEKIRKKDRVKECLNKECGHKIILEKE